MTDAHTEMHANYARANLLLGAFRPMTKVDVSEGRTDEVLRWCRDKLGGRDQDLVGPERWATASREGWSTRATYSCLPGGGTSWPRYVHEVAHFVYLMLPARYGGRNYDNHSLEHSRLELELTELVVSWLTDEANGIKRTSPPPPQRSPSFAANRKHKQICGYWLLSRSP